jgi:hypothetical protein
LRGEAVDQIMEGLGMTTERLPVPDGLALCFEEGWIIDIPAGNYTRGELIDFLFEKTGIVWFTVWDAIKIFGKPA